MAAVVNIRKKNLNKCGYKDFKEWNSVVDHVYIGRDLSYYVEGAKGSKWANPYSLERYTREESLALYKDYVLHSKKKWKNGKTLKQSLNELHGKTLGCWCAPERCHGDVLVSLLDTSQQKMDKYLIRDNFV